MVDRMIRDGIGIDDGCMGNGTKRNLDLRMDAPTEGEEACGASEKEARDEYVQESVECLAWKWRNDLRRENLQAVPLDESELKKLDSSIKKNTSVIKKLKNVTEDNKSGILKDILGVNLSKYVSEAVDAVSEGKPKSLDVQAYVEVCSLLHRRYGDFAGSLTKSLVQTFNPSRQKEEEKHVFGKKRAHLRLLVELLMVGVIKDPLPLMVVLNSLANFDFQSNQDHSLSNLSLLVAFLKQGGRDLLRDSGKKDFQGDVCMDLPFIATTQQQKMLQIFQRAWEKSTAEYLRLNTVLREMESKLTLSGLQRILPSKPQDELYGETRKCFESLHRSLQVLSEVLDEAVPEIPEENISRFHQGNPTGVDTVSLDKDVGCGDSPFEDDASRSFYEGYPDLKEMLPQAILTKYVVSDTGKEEEKQKSAEIEESQDEPGQPYANEGSDFNSKGEGKNREDGHTSGAGIYKSELKELLSRLPQCMSRDMSDQFSLDFCLMTAGPSKGARKRLASALCNLEKRQLEILPYCARIVAVLSTCFRDIAPLVSGALEEEFYFLAAKKDQINLESRMRNVRYIGELCKFRVLGTDVAFACLQACLEDFTHHNIDVACTFLETCGRFLYLLPESHTRMSNMLEVFMRLGRVKNLESRQTLLVENAYFQCKPPEKSTFKQKQLSPIQQYIRVMVMGISRQADVFFAVKQLRKLDWSHDEEFLIKCILKVHKNKFSQMRLIAKLVHDLSQFHETLGVIVADECWEKIRNLLENTSPQVAQKRIAFVKFFGELFAQRVVDLNAVLDLLYMILNFTPEGTLLDEVDLPDNFTRIRMVITLLETCGKILARSRQRKNLELYLLHFQLYYLEKAYLPMDVEYDLQDLFSMLKSERLMTKEEISGKIEELEASLALQSGSLAQPEKFMVLAAEEKVSDFGESDEDGMRDGQMLDADSGDENECADGEEASLESSSMSSDTESQVDEIDCEGDDSESIAEHDEEIATREEEDLFEREMNQLIGETQCISASMAPALTMFGSAAQLGCSNGIEQSAASERVPIKMVVKKGSKQQMHEVLVPLHSGLVQSAIQRKREEKEERDHLKQLVLEAHRRNIGEATHVGVDQMNFRSG